MYICRKGIQSFCPPPHKICCGGGGEDDGVLVILVSFTAVTSLISLRLLGPNYTKLALSITGISIIPNLHFQLSTPPDQAALAEDDCDPDPGVGGREIRPE